MKNQIIAWIGTMIAGAAGIGLFMKTYGARILKAVKTTRHAIDLIDEILEAVQPDADGRVTISTDEVKKFEEAAKRLREDLGLDKKEIKK